MTPPPWRTAPCSISCGCEDVSPGSPRPGRARPVRVQLRRRLEDSLLATFFRGLVIVIPLYLASLLVLKAMRTVAGLVRPVTLVVPDSVPLEKILSVLLLAADLPGGGRDRAHPGWPGVAPAPGATAL